MKITILDGRKKAVPCDLSNKEELTRVKKYTTRKINQQNIAELEQLQQQLEDFQKTKPKLFAKDNAAKELLGRVQKAVKAVKAKPVLNIKLIRKTYNINQPDELKKLKSRIAEYCKQGKEDLLKSIRKQLIALSSKYNNVLIRELIKLVGDYLKRLQAKDNYKPYTVLLENEFKLAKVKKNKIQRCGVIPKEKISKYADDTTLADYLAKPVTAKRRTGQDNVEELSACFWMDFLRNSNFFAKANDRNKLILYLVVVKNFYSHNASYYPAQGFGKSSKPECENPLFYIRSQSKHHEIVGYKNALGSKACCGLQNAAYLRMAQRCGALSKEYRNMLNEINRRGNPTAALKSQRMGETLAHLGSRANNVAQLYEVMEDVYDDKSSTKDGSELSRLLPYPAELDPQWEQANNQEQIVKVLEAFELLRSTNKPQLMELTQSDLTQHRSQQARKITAACNTLELKKLQVSSPANCPLIYIDLYPELIDGDYKQSVNVREGVTNVLLGFLGGLINHNAKERGLYYLVQRRQSFGFLRATFTDAGSLRIRLSLGAAPAPFNQLIIDSLRQFDALLTDYNFIKPNASKSGKPKKLVKAVLKPYEEGKGNQQTDKTGNYCFNAMRIEDDQWIALVVTQKLLQSNTLDQAFQQYLETFVLDRVEHKKVVKDYDHKFIPREGYAFAGCDTVSKRVSDTTSSKKQSPLFRLLNNLIETTISYVLSLVDLNPSCSTLYVLVKLLHNCQKGKAILKDMHEYERTHMQAKALLIIENILEYLVPLRCLANDTDNAKSDLKAIERDRFSTALKVKPSDFQLLYNDGGQQANNASIMAMCNQGIKNLYLFPGNYYEVGKFADDSGLSCTPKEEADLWFADITCIADVNEAIKTADHVRGLIIDITHDSTAVTLATLAALVKKMRKRGVWITLTCSTLKHEQLGQDKYQSGRSVIIAPPDAKLNPRTQKHLDEISEAAMNPLLASYRQIIETVVPNGNSELLATHGFFKPPQMISSPGTAICSPVLG